GGSFGYRHSAPDSGRAPRNGEVPSGVARSSSFFCVQPVERGPGDYVRARHGKDAFMSNWRRDWLTKPIFGWAQKALPSMSETERAAIEAGDVWWDAELFAGNPDWVNLLAVPPARLSDEVIACMNGPVEVLCDMLDEWKINRELGDLPPDVWDFMKSR